MCHLKNYFIRWFSNPKLDEWDNKKENGIDEWDNEVLYLLKAEFNFEEYLSCDTYIMNLELFTIDKSKEDKLSAANLSNTQEEGKEVILL